MLMHREKHGVSVHVHVKMGHAMLPGERMAKQCLITRETSKLRTLARGWRSGLVVIPSLALRAFSSFSVPSSAYAAVAGFLPVCRYATRKSTYMMASITTKGLNMNGMSAVNQW